MLPKRIIAKKYKFESKNELIKLTPVPDIFSEKEIREITRMEFKSHQCHMNSFFMAKTFKALKKTDL